MSISDERIERAARALWNYRHPLDPWDSEHFEGPSDSERVRALSEARAALEADAPALAAERARGVREGLTKAATILRKMSADAEKTADKFSAIFKQHADRSYVARHALEIGAETIDAHITKLGKANGPDPRT